MVVGGVDIHPSLYLQSVLVDCNLSKFDFQRDQKELDIIDFALQHNLPTLGICRGHQLLGIYHGLAEEFEMDLTRCTVVHQPVRYNIQYSKYDTMHYVDLLDERAFSVPNPEERKTVRKVLSYDNSKVAWVNSFHHQGIRYENCRNYEQNKIKVLATAPIFWDQQNKRKSIIELMSGENWLSVQWHPEFDHDVNSTSKTVLDKFEKILEGK